MPSACFANRFTAPFRRWILHLFSRSLTVGNKQSRDISSKWPLRRNSIWMTTALQPFDSHFIAPSKLVFPTLIWDGSGWSATMGQDPIKTAVRVPDVSVWVLSWKGVWAVSSVLSGTMSLSLELSCELSYWVELWVEFELSFEFWVLRCELSYWVELWVLSNKLNYCSAELWVEWICEFKLWIDLWVEFNCELSYWVWAVNWVVTYWVELSVLSCELSCDLKCEFWSV